MATATATATATANANMLVCSEASASMIDILRSTFPLQKLFTRISRRDRVHDVAGDDLNCVGTAVEMRDDDENHDCASAFGVDIGGDKRQIVVRSVVLRKTNHIWERVDTVERSRQHMHFRDQRDGIKRAGPAETQSQA